MLSEPPPSLGVQIQSMDTTGGGGGGRAEAERWLEIAVKLLGARDIAGSKKFAERALDSDPLLDGVDQILAVADVLLASQRRINKHPDWYSILQLDPSAGGPDPSAVKRQYRYLALLLHPDRNKAPGADSAFRLVVDAWAVLSDPSKKSLFDSELQIASASSNGLPSTPPSNPHAVSDPAAFWTACPFCCHVHQYTRVYLGRTIRCPSCRQAFRAAETASPPPVVAGTDMYYASWGFFPLGFPGGPGAANPFCSMYPSVGNQPAQPAYPAPRVAQPKVGEKRMGNVAEQPWEKSPARPKKKAARKKVMSNVKRTFSFGEAGAKIEVGGGFAATALQPEAVVPQQEENIESIMAVAPQQEGNIESINPDDVSTNVVGDVKATDIRGKEVGTSYNVEIDDVVIDLDAFDEVMDNLKNLPNFEDKELQNQTL